MELILSIIIFGFLGWGFSKTFRHETTTSKSNITRINDKNWIVNNKFVSFETDTPILRMQQENEDNKHYRNYEINKLTRDREGIFKDWIKTTRAINEYPNLKDSVTDGKLELITEKYEKYVFMCKKLDETMVLSKVEFLIKEENPIHCVDFFNIPMLTSSFFTYEIHNPETAKYRKGNMDNLMAAEFKAKWY